MRSPEEAHKWTDGTTVLFYSAKHTNRQTQYLHTNIMHRPISSSEKETATATNDSQQQRQWKRVRKQHRIWARKQQQHNTTSTTRE